MPSMRPPSEAVGEPDRRGEREPDGEISGPQNGPSEAATGTSSGRVETADIRSGSIIAAIATHHIVRKPGRAISRL